MGIDFESLLRPKRRRKRSKEVAVEKTELITLSLKPVLRPRIIQLPSPNRSSGAGRVIDMIVVHATEGAFAPSVDWLRKRNRPKRTSAHYVICKDGGIVQLVAESDKAWHAGHGRWNGLGGINTRSLGLELENANDGKDPYPKEQLEATLWLCQRACRKYPITLVNVVGHADVDPKRRTDPDGFPWDAFRASLYDALIQP